MAWTYSGNPAASARDEVRFLTADTDSKKAWTLQDGEVDYAVAKYSDNVLLAAAVCAEAILGKFKAVEQSRKLGDLSVDYTGQFKFYSDLSYTLRQRANLAGVAPYAGGVSIAEKQAQDADADRQSPAAKIDGMNWAQPLNNPTTSEP